MKSAHKYMTDEPTQDQVKELFDHRDGNLYWNVSRQAINIGDLAGYINSHGYRHIKINGKMYYAHRLIFLYHHGFLPEYLDHIDGDPLNNDINNLRETTTSQNGMNRKANKSYNSKPPTSIYKGVSWNKQSKKWRAEIQISGKRAHLGLFASELAAARAYDTVASELYGKFAKLNLKYSQNESNYGDD